MAVCATRIHFISPKYIYPWIDIKSSTLGQYQSKTTNLGIAAIVVLIAQSIFYDTALLILKPTYKDNTLT